MNYHRGQLVKVSPQHLEKTELWPGPPMHTLDVPIRSVDAGTLCVVLDECNGSYKVLVGSLVGWLDEHDLEACEKSHADVVE